jgi:hypothetical protein
MPFSAPHAVDRSRSAAFVKASEILMLYHLQGTGLEFAFLGAVFIIPAFARKKTLWYNS